MTAHMTFDEHLLREFLRLYQAPSLKSEPTDGFADRDGHLVLCAVTPITGPAFVRRYYAGDWMFEACREHD